MIKSDFVYNMFQIENKTNNTKGCYGLSTPITVRILSAFTGLSYLEPLRC